jgi:hypothetical protein
LQRRLPDDSPNGKQILEPATNQFPEAGKFPFRNVHVPAQIDIYRQFLRGTRLPLGQFKIFEDIFGQLSIRQCCPILAETYGITWAAFCSQLMHHDYAFKGREISLQFLELNLLKPILGLFLLEILDLAQKSSATR